MSVRVSSNKPLDFGDSGITGSVDDDGCLIALNTYHPTLGYATLTAAEPFPDSERYNQAAVRAYRAGLARLRGFGLRVDAPVRHRSFELAGSAIPRIRIDYTTGTLTVTTLAVEGGAVQVCDAHGVTPEWRGRLSLQRCAYTQLTEGGPIPAPPLAVRAHYDGNVLTIENPALELAVALVGLEGGSPQSISADTPVELVLPARDGHTVLVYGFGPNIERALRQAQRIRAGVEQRGADQLLHEAASIWQRRLANIPEDPLLRRGLVYCAQLAVPVGDTVCLLTDHMLLPLSWNRDAYYMALALLSWNLPETRDLVRRHLYWMFEQAERHAGAWGRCYLVNGLAKDHAFQLDQQLYPLLELAEYLLATGDGDTRAQLAPHVAPVIDMLLARRSPDCGLFPTDETPADDPIALPYHLSSHILFWRVCKKLQQAGIEGPWDELADDLRSGIARHFIAERDGVTLYAYATDGRGNHHFYHDANDLPLALAPYWGFIPPDDAIWRATMDFAFSDANTGGAYGGQLGSVHTPAPWPLGDIQELLFAGVTGDTQRGERARSRLWHAAQRDGALPEAYDPITGEVVSRHWFGWPNAAYAVYILGGFVE